MSQKYANEQLCIMMGADANTRYDLSNGRVATLYQGQNGNFYYWVSGPSAKQARHWNAIEFIERQKNRTETGEPVSADASWQNKDIFGLDFESAKRNPVVRPKLLRWQALLTRSAVGPLTRSPQRPIGHTPASANT